MKGIAAMIASGRKLQIVSWNIAAINNNPFEYWITYNENPSYEKLMSDVESFIESPGDRDVKVSDVFADDMFSKLEDRMLGCGWPSVRGYWEEEYMNRKIISGFMKDSLLGSKRLASMPDRITNTINVAGSHFPVCRPTVINMYDGDLGTLERWWPAWEGFMFDNALEIKTKKGVKEKIPYQLLQPIKKSKYPEISVEEEQVSLPLQTLCCAIFDAILIHIMNAVSTEWQPIKRAIVESLIKEKVTKTLDILETATYIDSDIITLQEVSSAFIDHAMGRPKLGNMFWIIAPGNMDAVRDQNSVIFLRRETFPEGQSMEITSQVESSFEQGVEVPIAKGDILAITATDREGIPFVVASFHGDTNGLATKHVLDAIVKTMSSDSTLSGHKLLFGLDANTYEKAKHGKQQGVSDWGEHYVSLDLTSCWGDVPNPKNYTTFNSRTFLQPQLNKACKKSDKRSNGDVNLKDFILFGVRDFSVEEAWKDNTGQKKYLEDTAFPTIDFPSDHGIIAAIIRPTLAESCEDKTP